MKTPLKNIQVVLVRPSRPGNIGSAARAVKNMGLARLVLVQAVNHLTSEAYTMAYGAHDVLEKARVAEPMYAGLGKSTDLMKFTNRTFLPSSQAGRQPRR